MTRLLLLPGWHDSGPGHWQSRWPLLHHGDQARFLKVEQDDWVWPKRGDWMMNLDEALLADPEPAILVAHSLGCHLVAAWAAHSWHTARVKGAWLVAPPDLDGNVPNAASVAPQLHGWRSVVRRRLPFQSTVLASRTDPHAAFDRSQALAQEWGSVVQDLGDAGHVNEASGHGDWALGWLALQRDVASWCAKSP
ncbi:alpha/beta hydrolase [Aquabacterium sp.]|uniref:RBBP9/YdeN family alpha/beta hydrolase n=1 Tax=Aquabacterium sp. TaxID=1872578 RepID=UPI0019C2BF09|nr:alpha/beta hydrolase [Aquabacterium sp.]MBC7701305.1 serine hydrolase family protein [Aquabacterium sp.]